VHSSTAGWPEACSQVLIHFRSSQIADSALVNRHDAEVSESVQIAQFRTVGSAGTSPTGMSCRGEYAGGAHGTLVLLSRDELLFA
jgi:hypothetical protein